MISIMMSAPFIRMISDLDVQKKKIFDRECIYLKFSGIFKKKNAQMALNKSEELMLQEPNKKFTLVWNCINMTDCDSDAQNLLQRALLKSKDNVDCLCVITNSLTIHAATEMIAFFSSTKIRVVRTLEELEGKLSY